jgi:cytochrome b561
MNWPMLLAFRFLGGLGIGGSSVLGPVYIAEIAPAKWRGRLVGVFQLNIVIGILLAYLSNSLIAAHFVTNPEHIADQWRWQLGIASLPAVLFLVLLYTIPRSSRWLVTRDRIDEARQVLQLMGTPNTEAELQEIRDSIHFEKSALHEALFQPKYMKPVVLAIVIALFNQLSGINAILYYVNDIFLKAGLSSATAGRSAVYVGAVNLLFTLIGMSLIDKLGRKTRDGDCAGRRGSHLPDTTAPGPAGVDVDWLHCVVRGEPGRSGVGLSERNFPDARARQRPEPGQLNALAGQRVYRVFISAGTRAGRRRLSVLFFCGDDGVAVLCRGDDLPGDERA